MGSFHLLMVFRWVFLFCPFFFFNSEIEQFQFTEVEVSHKIIRLQGIWGYHQLKHTNA